MSIKMLKYLVMFNEILVCGMRHEASGSVRRQRATKQSPSAIKNPNPPPHVSLNYIGRRRLWSRRAVGHCQDAARPAEDGTPVYIMDSHQCLLAQTNGIARWEKLIDEQRDAVGCNGVTLDAVGCGWMRLDAVGCGGMRSWRPGCCHVSLIQAGKEASPFCFHMQILWSYCGHLDDWTHAEKYPLLKFLICLN